jgi:hypothetical protein
MLRQTSAETRTFFATLPLPVQMLSLIPSHSLLLKVFPVARVRNHLDYLEHLQWVRSQWNARGYECQLFATQHGDQWEGFFRPFASSLEIMVLHGEVWIENATSSPSSPSSPSSSSSSVKRDGWVILDATNRRGVSANSAVVQFNDWHYVHTRSDYAVWYYLYPLPVSMSFASALMMD